MMHTHTHTHTHILIVDSIVQAEEEIKKFLSEEHTFPEYEQMVLQYEEIIKEIQFGIEKV